MLAGGSSQMFLHCTGNSRSVVGWNNELCNCPARTTAPGSASRVWDLRTSALWGGRSSARAAASWSSGWCWDAFGAGCWLEEQCEAARLLSALHHGHPGCLLWSPCSEVSNTKLGATRWKQILFFLSSLHLSICLNVSCMQRGLSRQKVWMGPELPSVDGTSCPYILAASRCTLDWSVTAELLHTAQCVCGNLPWYPCGAIARKTRFVCEDCHGTLFCSSSDSAGTNVLLLRLLSSTLWRCAESMLRRAHV